MPVDTHDDIMPATGVVNPNGVETHEDIKPAMGLEPYSDKTEIKKPTGFRIDNPGGRWLQEKQERAFRPNSSYGKKGLSGSATGYAGMGDNELYLPVSELSKLRGVNDERPMPGMMKYDDLLKSVEDKGYTHENPVMVFVNHKGQAFLNEGNNRVAVAKAKKIPAIRAEIHWFNGAEDTPGPWHPDAVANMESDNRKKRAFGGGITPIELNDNNLEDEARRLILWSYAAAPMGRNLALSREDGGRTYPLATPTEIKEDIKDGKAKMKHISPQEFLNEADPLHIGKGDRHIIHSFSDHIKAGDPLGPLKLYEDGHQDGRHRANAAKVLGIKKVPVVDYRKADGGPVDDAQNAVDVARNLTLMGFYSAAAEAASKIPQRAPIDQIINKVKGSPNVKAEELDWSGVRNAFAGQKSVDPAQVAQHLQANLPQIQETVYGYDSKTKQKTPIKPRYQDYATPGGQNYREVLLHLPEQGDGDYQSSHWGQYGANRPAVKNILAHLRMTDRGMKGLGNPEALHIEEVQSDWGQEGRDLGFDKRKGLNAEERKELNQLVSVPMRERTSDQMNRFNELINQRDFQSIPSAPHVTSTEGWTDLALKRALREAAQGKYTKLTWTPGEEQAERYGLDKSFSQIHYSPDTKHLFAKGKGDVDDINMNVHEGALSSFIGKELAEKLLARPPIDNTQPLVKGDTVKSLIGGQLAVPQKGMRDYYDRVIPNRLQKLVSKLDPDAKVQLYGHKIDVPGENYPSDANDWQGDEDDWDFKKVHSLEITPKLRAAILKGLPAYEHGGPVVDRAFEVLSKFSR